MPDVTAPPVLIDIGVQESAQISGQFQNPYFQGPFKIGSNLYCVLQQTVAAGAIFNLNVFKSTDGGLTWTLEDGANSPTVDQTAGFARVQARLNPDGVTITIGFTPVGGSNTVNFVTFSSVTDLFTAGVIPPVVASTGFDFVTRVNGEMVIFYALIVAPRILETDIGFSVLSGGVWSAFVSIAAGDDPTKVGWSVPAVILDTASGVTKAFCRRTQLVGVDSFINDYYFELNAANASTVPTQQSNRVQNDRPNYGRMVIFNDSLCFPVYTVDGAATTFTMRVYIGAPLAAPVFTFTDLDTGPTVTFDCECGQLAVDSGILWAVWIFAPDSGPATSLKLRRATNDGSGWTAIQDFYDLFTNPPNAQAPDQQFMYAMNVGLRGSLGAIITVNDAANFSIVSYFLLGPAAPPPPPAAVKRSDIQFWGVLRYLLKEEECE
jgi:hypothetical protein